MSVWSDVVPSHTSPLLGPDGVLVVVRIRCEANRLEDLLEALAELPHPLNPQIRHHQGGGPETIVEVPAYGAWIEEMSAALTGAGFPTGALEVVPA